MIVKNEIEINGLKAIGAIVREIREVLIHASKPGVTTKSLDNMAKALFEKHHASSAPIVDYDFPGYTCISINEVAAHGIPSDYVLKEGDVINIDVSGEKDGYYADTGATKIIGDQCPDNIENLIEASQIALEKGIDAAIVGNRVNQIGKAIETCAKSFDFKVIRNLTGHGIGLSLHESPNQISNYYVASENQKLKRGHVLAIETFISLEDDFVSECVNEWELVTKKNNRTAQFEHTVIVTDDGPLIIT